MTCVCVCVVRTWCKAIVKQDYYKGDSPRYKWISRPVLRCAVRLLVIPVGGFPVDMQAPVGWEGTVANGGSKSGWVNKLLS